jgi:hypothetical protein
MTTTTMRFWGPVFDDRRARTRVAADFYAIELAGGGRYLRRVRNVSRDGLLLESPFADERPGQTVELELPRPRPAHPLRVTAKVVRVMPQGGIAQIAVRRVEPGEPLPADLGGRESL